MESPGQKCSWNVQSWKFIVPEYKDVSVLAGPTSPIEKGEDNGDESQKKPDTSTEVQQKGKTKRKKKRKIPSRSSGSASVSSEGKEIGQYEIQNTDCRLYTKRRLRIINNYSPKWSWIVVDICPSASRVGRYPPLAPIRRSTSFPGVRLQLL